MKILNLYAGIGGNRKLWGDSHEITAIEYKPEIAKIYQDFFPNDNVIVADAHQYLLECFSEFDFIWSSPPCPTHSNLRKGISMQAGAKAVFPDMKLYEEILFLQGYFQGKYCVENVVSWYDPLIPPMTLSRHYYWANFVISNKYSESAKIHLTNSTNNNSENDEEQVARLEKELGYDLSNFGISRSKKRLLLRNCVEPEIGKHILNCAINSPSLFGEKITPQNVPLL